MRLNLVSSLSPGLELGHLRKRGFELRLRNRLDRAYLLLHALALSGQLAEIACELRFQPRKLGNELIALVAELRRICCERLTHLTAPLHLVLGYSPLEFLGAEALCLETRAFLGQRFAQLPLKLFPSVRLPPRDLGFDILAFAADLRKPAANLGDLGIALRDLGPHLLLQLTHHRCFGTLKHRHLGGALGRPCRIEQRTECENAARHGKQRKHVHQKRKQHAAAPLADGEKLGGYLETIALGEGAISRRISSRSEADTPSIRCRAFRRSLARRNSEPITLLNL